ncbi:MAG: MarR family winged helix-turn-helix transcriptional regulator [Anaerobacillus sp.]|uniref:MarR family winged helix-turn-helix transcriptional regulator n=1 Tax=Anaerobacillus sp. TaxID=1872506 RepID=UPI00391DA18D
MRETNDEQKYIFGSLFLLANKLQVKGDQMLGDDGMTLRQWFLTVMILQFKEQSPTLGEVANLMGTSHQNVKQLAKKLEEKQFLTFTKDAQDGRIVRLQLTELSRDYWSRREGDGDRFIEKLFLNVSDEEIRTTISTFNKLFEALESWEE